MVGWCCSIGTNRLFVCCHQDVLYVNISAKLELQTRWGRQLGRAICGTLAGWSATGGEAALAKTVPLVSAPRYYQCVRFHFGCPQAKFVGFLYFVTASPKLLLEWQNQPPSIWELGGVWGLLWAQISHTGYYCDSECARCCDF